MLEALGDVADLAGLSARAIEAYRALRTPPEALAAITMPTLVVCGEQDQDNGSAPELVAALADAELATIPGTHMSSVTEPELGEAIAAFLTA